MTAPASRDLEPASSDGARAIQIGQSCSVQSDQDTCTVRTAQRRDLLALLRVYAQRDSDTPLPDAPSDLQVRVWERIMSTADLRVYLAELNDEPVGTATLLMMPNLTYSGPTAFIEAVVVAVDHRRKDLPAAVRAAQAK